jgi:hypothetical protein
MLSAGKPLSMRGGALTLVRIEAPVFAGFGRSLACPGVEE